MSNRIATYISSQEKKRHNAIEACIEFLIKRITEHDFGDKHRRTYRAKMEALENLKKVERIYTPTVEYYLAGASSIVNLNPPVSASSLLENAVFHKSDTEALLSDWRYVSDDFWSAYFSAEYATLNTKGNAAK